MAFAEGVPGPGLDREVPALVMRLDRNALHHGTMGVIRSLGRAGVQVHALLDGPDTPSARSRYLHRLHQWPAAPVDPELALAVLAGVSTRIGRRCLLLPVDDVGALLVAEHAATLADRFLLPAQPPDLPRRLADKAVLAGLCAELGLAHPEVRLPGSVDEVADAVAALGLPVVGKWSRPWLLPAGRGLRSTSVLRSVAEAAALFARTADAGSQLVLQRFLPPTPGGDWFFHGYLGDAAAWLAGGTGRKERAYPAEAGMTTLGRWLPNAAVRATALRLVAAVGYRGLLDLDFRYEPKSGSYHLLDANPRLGAQFRLFVDEHALDLVRTAHLHLTGREVPVWGPRHGRAFLVENYDLLSAGRLCRTGLLSPAGWWRSVCRVDELAWFARDDPGPFVAMTAHSIRLRLRRTVGSMRDGRRGQRVSRVDRLRIGRKTSVPCRNSEQSSTSR